MKKLLGIIVLGLLLSGNVYAQNPRMSMFNLWLSENGYHQYLSKEQNPICKDEPKYSTHWYGNNCDKFEGSNNLNIKINNKVFTDTTLAYHSNPNRDTLIFYLWKYSYRDRAHYMREILKPTNNSYDFKFNLIEDKYLKKQMKTKGILSYLYYQDGEVLIDEFSPKERLGEFLNNETKFISHSMSKSVTSYILGHAICEGYIDGVDARVNDWPVIKDSLYHNQKLINFLNMNTGDQKYVDEWNGKITPLGGYEGRSIKKTMLFYFRNKNTKKSKDIYNYNGFVTHLIVDYIKFKTGEDYDKLYSKIFNDKVKIKHSISYDNKHSNIKATRFDYLRIAKAIMDDYQNDTCVGKYLKEIHKRNEPAFNRTGSYGGQFHFDYPGLKNKVIFGMGGYGGQAILIDMENSRIVVLNSLHYNKTKYKYNHKKLLINPIKKGK